jgi:hypothetical protein
MRRSVIATALALALTAAGLALTAAPARAAGTTTATFVEQSSWGAGYVGSFKISNDSAGPVTWRVEFDLPAGTSVASSWGATLTRTGDHYAAVGVGWNSTLAAGASTTFGWLAQGTGRPLNCSLNGGPCTGGGTATDIHPPTQPANFRAVISGNQQILRWDAAGDDVGVTGYEVYVGGNLVATVTGTQYAMPIPPPAIITYRVRALDAAGNASPYAEITPGGATDTVAPTAPSNLLMGSDSGRVVLSWTAATDNRGVTGYNVFVNNVHMGATSRTSLTIPPIGFGEFRFEVEAFDAAGLRSPRLSRWIAVDPGPTSDARAPLPPTSLGIAGLSATEITWSWNASTDNVGVAGYEVYSGGIWKATVTGTTYRQPRAPGQTTFNLAVRAFDAIGNKSAFTSVTLVIDMPPPSASATP